MKLRYLTTDQTDGATASILAALFGVDLDVVQPPDLPGLEAEQAHLILDWDFLSDGDRHRLLNGTPAHVVAIHGHDLGEALASFLPRRGILCSPRLDERLFQALADSASAA